MTEGSERVELTDDGGVEIEIIHGDWPLFYVVLIFESADDRPDYLTEWDRVTGQPKRGAWSRHADAFTLWSARRKARRLRDDYRTQNPKTYARLSEAKKRVDDALVAESAAAAIVAGTVVSADARSRISGLAE